MSGNRSRDFAVRRTQQGETGYRRTWAEVVAEAAPPPVALHDAPDLTDALHAINMRRVRGEAPTVAEENALAQAVAAWRPMVRRS